MPDRQILSPCHSEGEARRISSVFCFVLRGRRSLWWQSDANQPHASFSNSTFQLTSLFTLHLSDPSPEFLNSLRSLRNFSLSFLDYSGCVRSNVRPAPYGFRFAPPYRKSAARGEGTSPVIASRRRSNPAN